MEARSLKRRQLFVWAIVIAFPVISIPLAIANWPGPWRSESVEVPVTGAPSSSDYSVRGQGSITSTSGADYKGRAFRETTLDIEIKGSPTATRLEASLVMSSGAAIPCSSHDATPLSSDSWSTVVITCPFIDFEALEGIGSVSVAEDD